MRRAKPWLACMIAVSLCELTACIRYERSKRLPTRSPIGQPSPEEIAIGGFYGVDEMKSEDYAMKTENSTLEDRERYKRMAADIRNREQAQASRADVGNGPLLKANNLRTNPTSTTKVSSRFRA